MKYRISSLGKFTAFCLVCCLLVLFRGEVFSQNVEVQVSKRDAMIEEMRTRTISGVMCTEPLLNICTDDISISECQQALTSIDNICQSDFQPIADSYVNLSDEQIVELGPIPRTELVRCLLEKLKTSLNLSGEKIDECLASFD